LDVWKIRGTLYTINARKPRTNSMKNMVQHMIGIVTARIGLKYRTSVQILKSFSEARLPPLHTSPKRPSMNPTKRMSSREK